MHRFFLNNWIVVQVTSLKFKSCILLTTKGASFCIRMFGLLLNLIRASKHFDNAKVHWWAWTNFGPYHKHWGSTYVLKHCRPCYNFNSMMLECLFKYTGTFHYNYQMVATTKQSLMAVMSTKSSYILSTNWLDCYVLLTICLCRK